MNYNTQYGSPNILAQIFLSIFITAIAYGVFPMVFALYKPKITAKRYCWICFLVNFMVYLCFSLIDGNYNAAPYFLWTFIYYTIFKRLLPKIETPADCSETETESFEEISQSIPEDVLEKCEAKRGSRDGITSVAESFVKEGVIPAAYVPALVDEFMKPANKKQALAPVALPSESEQIFCRSCGKQIPNDSKFCSYCGTEVKLSADTPVIPAAIPASANEQQKAAPEKSTDYRAFIAIGAIVLLLLVAVSVIIGMVSRSEKAEPTPAPTETVAPTPEPTLTRYSMPNNGHMFITPDYEGVCPFSFSGESGASYYVYLEYQYAPSNSYYERFEDSPNPTEEDVAFFVRPGYSVEIDVPVGVYKLYYAKGNGWYGEKDLFGKDTTYYKSNDLLEFYTDYSTAYGMTINLWSQYGDILDTNNISASQFPG